MLYEIFSLHSGWPHCTDVVEVLNLMAWVFVEEGLSQGLGLVFSLVDAC